MPPTIKSRLPSRGFVPPTAAGIEAALESFFSAVEDLVPGKWRACLAPHAGWTYSGQVAADVYRRTALPDAVIILCPKHTRPGANCAAAPVAGWAFPHRTIASDPGLAGLLADGIDELELDLAPHEDEHAIEAHLPLIAYRNPNARVVGITIGRMNETMCLRFAEQLANVLDRCSEEVLLVISSDMNHFGTDSENRRLDAMAIDCLLDLNSSRLVSTCRENNITMCGLWPAMIVLETLRIQGRLNVAHQTGYATSADAGGDKNRVVGYAGMLFGEPT